MTPKQRYHATIRGEPADRVPVTPIFMAWAAHLIGRTYRDYYLDGDVLVAAQLAAARLLGTDQVSAISDPWREASGFGMAFDYPEQGVGIPRGHLLGGPGDVAKLQPGDVGASPRMRQRVDSVGKLAAAVGRTHSVLGWVEGPLAEYADLRGLEQAMLDLATDPEMYLQAAEVIVATAIDFATAQVESGADVIGVGDAAASLIGPDMYVQFVAPLEQRLFKAIHDAGALVKLHICGDINSIIGHMPETGADVIDVDWMVPLAEARHKVGPEVALCGNFDPVAVLQQSTPEAVAQAARRNIADAGERFILQPGCEVPPATPQANLRAFCPGRGCLISAALRRSGGSCGT